MLELSTTNAGQQRCASIEYAYRSYEIYEGIFWTIPAVVVLLLATFGGVEEAQAKVPSAFSGIRAVTQIPTLATYAFAINSRGDIAGTYVTRTGNHGFLLRDGIYTKFDDPAAANYTEAKGINTAGDIVGDYADSQNHFHGFLLHDSKYSTLNVPGAVNGTFPYGITDAGDIVGFYTDRRGSTHGFLLHDGIYATLDVP
ncbi:MAG: hypothetical protein ABI406_07245 [Ktedonobacteraceae bacterium]